MARHGLVDLINMGIRFYKTNTSNFYAGLKPSKTEPSSSFDVFFLSSLPGVTSVLTVSPTGDMGTASLGGSGTVTSVTAGNLTDIFTASVATNTTTPAISFTKVSQNANLFYASPSGSNGSPTFRSLLYADISALVGTGANSIAAGNDSRFHTQNTDTGTTQASFMFESGATNTFQIVNNAGAAILRNKANTANANLTVNDLTVSGNIVFSGNTATVISANQVNVGDAIFTLNSDIAVGTSPTEDAGLEVNRGNATFAQIIWNETLDEWQAGLIGSSYRILRQRVISFVNSDIVGGVLTVAHNLGNQRVDVYLVDNNNKVIKNPDEITQTNANNCAVDVTFLGTITGTWYAVVSG